LKSPLLMNHEPVPPVVPDAKPDVVIIGAGPAGMMLAYLLVTNGISVRVLERHTDFKREFRGEGIQPSVMAVLDELGFLPVLMEKGIAIPAEQAKIFLDEKLIVTLGGLEGESEDFGLIVFQEGFLGFLHELCSAYPHYRLDMGFTVTEPVFENGTVTAVLGRRKGGAEERIEGRLFVVAAGRNTALRKKTGIAVDVLESTFNIYWLKFDAPTDLALIPNGFRAYLKDDSMFIFYRTYDHRLQVAWGKREWAPQSFRDLDQLKKQLVTEMPRDYRSIAARQFGEHTERQLLKVACDRMQRWSVPGMLFIGDAAHTMSPVAGQGINLAVRDSIVAANHLIAAKRQGLGWDSALLQKIEAERRPEVEALQAFQVSLGYLMLGAPRWQTRIVFRWLMPVLSTLGIRQHYVRQVQGGKSTVKVHYPVKLAEIAG
jgi:2-polyprenyl-6-methoxyphenol hydroxylase-like FAD-dependent oxidoreductase